MKKTFVILMVLCCLGGKPKGPEYRSIKIEEIFSKLITRDETDRVYSGQIKSEVGLVAFGQKYRVDIDKSLIDFEKYMLIFGITDKITTRAFQFLEQKKMRLFILDYYQTGIKYKLRRFHDGKHHSYLQVFLLKKIENIPHIAVRNHEQNGLSKIYDTSSHVSQNPARSSLADLSIVRIVLNPFKLEFKEISEKQIGTKVDGFEIVGYEEKFEWRDMPKYGERKKVNVSEITLKRGDKTIKLIKGKNVQYDELIVHLKYKTDQKIYALRTGEEIDIGPRKLRLLKVNIDKQTCTLEDVKSGEEFIINGAKKL